MTLIAAFWCAGDQAVLLADSMEYWGAFKTSVTKLAPQDIGDLYQIAYAGSGLSDFVDSFGESLEQRFVTSRNSDRLGIQNQIRRALVNFYNSPAIKAYPTNPDDPNSHLSGVVCVRVVPLQKVFLYKFKKTVVLPVTTYALSGVEDAVYEHIAKRLYRPQILPLQARLLGLHLMSEAAATSTLIDHPMRVVFAMTHGMFASDDDTELYLSAIKGVQRTMDSLLLASADIHAVTDEHLNARLKLFGQKIRQVRRQHRKIMADGFKQHLKLLDKEAKAGRSTLRSPKRGRKGRTP